MDSPACLEALLVRDTVDAVVYADVDGLIRLWNPAAEALFGVPAAQALGASLDLVIPPRLREAHWRGYHAAMASGRTRLGGRPAVTRALHPGGATLYVEMSFSLVRDGAGQVIGSVAIARDVTDREQQARTARTG